MNGSCQELLVRQIWRLYVADGTHRYSQKSDGGWGHVKKALAFSDTQASLKEATHGEPTKT